MSDLRSAARFGIAGLCCLAADQGSKALVLRYLDQERRVLPFLSLTRTTNPGVCFGLFSDGRITGFILAGSFAVASLIAIYMFRSRDVPRFLQITMGMIEGGVLGNLLDRLRFGAVIDFLNFHVWPVFNIADTCIVTGVALTLVFNLRSGKRDGGFPAANPPEAR